VFGVVAVLASYDVAAAVPVLLLAGVLSISWNGLAFTAVGELAGPGRAGAALGVQNTGVALGAALTAPLLAALVERTSWGVGYAAAGVVGVAAVLLLGPVARREVPHPTGPAADGVT
jgi:MFS family permease